MIDNLSKREILIGCVADDFTGAGDAASFLAANGIRTLLINGIPSDEDTFSSEYEAIVIALKSRTQKTPDAVADTLAGFDWLKRSGAKTLYFKYCSTFDSTPKGNIGPVIDAVLEKYNIPYTILCPALPVNGRTVKDGILYVNGVPLAESHMKDHPLTPMWESDITKLMAPQSKYPCFKITYEELISPEAVKGKVGVLVKDNEHFCLSVDYFEEIHGSVIMDIFDGIPFMTGGSGILADFAKHVKGAAEQTNMNSYSSTGSRVLFAGSCSVATIKQVTEYLSSGQKGYMVSPVKLRNGEQTVDILWEFIAKAQLSHEDILLYSPGSYGQTEENGNYSDSSLLEETFAELAKRASDNGCRKIVSAGGETSGAITQALGFRSFYIGETVAPGVPIMVPTENTSLQLVLKSGNFGEPDFLSKVLKED